MSANRRNYYRILQIQPEAPPEVIKASWRALMHAGRGHPDLGGDPVRASLINEAYAVLSDPDKRQAYDRVLDLRSLRANAHAHGPGAGPGPRPAARRVDPSTWRADRSCPMCRAPLPAVQRADPRCVRCDAPLTLPATGGSTERELWGRRASMRRPRSDAAAMITDWRGMAIEARMVDLSLGGAGLMATEAVSPGTPVRIVSSSLDAVARVMACHRSASHWRVRVLWLTVKPIGTKGVYLRTVA
ncbi:MAG: DnaJ domain-containing protein [Burkholderiaceae bacterium]